MTRFVYVLPAGRFRWEVRVLDSVGPRPEGDEGMSDLPHGDDCECDPCISAFMASVRTGTLHTPSPPKRVRKPPARPAADPERSNQ